MTKARAIVDRLVSVARASMPAGEAARFQREIERIFNTRVRRDPKDLEREQLLERHCPAQLPPITIDRPSRPTAGRKRRKHSWSKPKQLRLL